MDQPEARSVFFSLTSAALSIVVRWKTTFDIAPKFEVDERGRGRPRIA